MSAHFNCGLSRAAATVLLLPLVLLPPPASAAALQLAAPDTLLQAYRAELSRFRQEFGGTHDLPDERYFLFGLGLRQPYDRNNNGETEADDLGQALFLVSLVSKTNHPLVPKVLAEVPLFERHSAGIRMVSEQYTKRMLAAPHTWHAAEILLYLLGAYAKVQPAI